MVVVAKRSFVFGDIMFPDSNHLSNADFSYLNVIKENYFNEVKRRDEMR